MSTRDASAALWREQVRAAGSIEQTRLDLARLIEEDHDPAEVFYYESASDPDSRRLNKAQRSYVGQYERRLRRLRSRFRDIPGMI